MTVEAVFFVDRGVRSAAIYRWKAEIQRFLGLFPVAFGHVMRKSCAASKMGLSDTV